MKLPEKIVYYRKRAGLSQEALAEQMHVSRQAISKWETGEAVPELSKVVLLAHIFGITTDELLLEELNPCESSKDPAPTPAPRNWVESIPGVIGRLLRRYGWLLGVYIAGTGALFTAMGALAQSIAGSMISGFDSFGGFGSELNGLGFGPGTILEINGVSVNGISDFAASNPVSMLGGFIMAVGIVMMIGGGVLAVVLYKNKQK